MNFTAMASGNVMNNAMQFVMDNALQIATVQIKQSSAMA
jgi:hypothetical protein